MANHWDGLVSPVKGLMWELSLFNCSINNSVFIVFGLGVGGLVVFERVTPHHHHTQAFFGFVP